MSSVAPLGNDELAGFLASRRSLKERVGAQEWQQRVELAACYRLIAHFRMTDWIYNHISARVPDTDGEYLINPFGLLYEEVTASSLIKVNVGGQLVEDVPLDVNPAAFIIHGAVHKARHDAACVIHTHTPAGIAVAAQKGGLLPLSQHALKFHGRIGYHGFEGIALREDEQARLVANLGTHNALILLNHGLLTVGSSVADAFKTMFFLERACQIQVAALSGGREYVEVSPEISVTTSAIFAGDNAYLKNRDWNALIRLLDRTDPSYKQ